MDRDELTRDDAFEEGVVSLHSYDTPQDRERAKEAVSIARIRTLQSRHAPTEAVRSMDESGSPESVGCIAQAWIDERAQEVSRLFGPERCEITQEPAKALILSVDRKPWYVATTWRDPMNFAQMVRWMATAGNPAVTALATDTTPSRDEEGSVDREAVARTIDPIAFKSHEEMIAYCLRQGDSEEMAKRYADGAYGRTVDEAYAKADAILALKTSTPETQTVDEQD